MEPDRRRGDRVDGRGKERGSKNNRYAIPARCWPDSYDRAGADEQDASERSFSTDREALRVETQCAHRATACPSGRVKLPDKTLGDSFRPQSPRKLAGSDRLSHPRLALTGLFPNRERQDRSVAPQLGRCRRGNRAKSPQGRLHAPAENTRRLRPYFPAHRSNAPAVHRLSELFCSH